MRIWRMELILAIAIILAINSSAEEYGGIDFPNGDISFADRIISYKHAEGVESDYANPSSALGPPDYDGQGDAEYVSLGNGKSVCEAELILEFIDNALVDIQGDDLWIFEIGPMVEATDVYISDDGENWISLGVVKGSTRGVDISSYTSPGQRFHFVKLCDHPDGRTSGSPYGGPDIDAVGAIGTIAIEQPPIMHPTPEQMSEWVSLYENAPAAAGTVSEEPDFHRIVTYSANREGDSFSLLEYLQYNPDERSQGSCGDCWQWAGTAVMEIQLAYEMGILDRFSVQYINSNIEGLEVKGEPCCGDWIDTFAEFYSDRKQAVPWTNYNANWMDAGVSCKTCPEKGESTVAAGSTSTSPAYPIASIRTERLPTRGMSATTATNNIKSVLHQGKAVWFAYFLPDKTEWNKFRNFWNNQQEYSVIKLDAASGKQYNFSTGEGGGHAVVIVGYDETDPNNRYWIVLNSWGTENGLRPNGLFRVSMDMNYDCQYTNPIGSPINALFFETLDITYAVQDNQFSGDLTGIWNCNDGGTYYIRQIGDILWWDGDSGSNGTTWGNVAHGTIDGNTINLEYADVPEGSARRFGKLILNIVSDDELEAMSKPESYEGSRWWRESKSQPPLPPTPIDTDPWNDPSVRSLIDEWLLLQDKCLKQDNPGQYIDRWARICGENLNCDIEPDHPSGWDNFHWIWVNALAPGHLGINVRDYVERRQNGESYESLAICRG